MCLRPFAKAQGDIREYPQLPGSSQEGGLSPSALPLLLNYLTLTFLFQYAIGDELVYLVLREA